MRDNTPLNSCSEVWMLISGRKPPPRGRRIAPRAAWRSSLATYQCQELTHPRRLRPWDTRREGRCVQAGRFCRCVCSTHWARRPRRVHRLRSNVGWHTRPGSRLRGVRLHERQQLLPDDEPGVDGGPMRRPGAHLLLATRVRRSPYCLVLFSLVLKVMREQTSVEGNA